MKKRLLFAGTTLLLVGIIGCSVLCAQQRTLADKLIRFHVVADSDSAEAQALKLTVRDALLEELEPFCLKAESRDEMLNLLKEALPELKEKAEKTLRQLGCNDSVEVSLKPERFPTRFYDTFTLPAGKYMSLLVRLGSGQGHNWWCVCFPSLCSSACTEDLEAIATSAGFTDEEIEWITDSDHYVLRFKLLEWLAALKD